MRKMWGEKIRMTKNTKAISELQNQDSCNRVEKIIKIIVAQVIKKAYISIIMKNLSTQYYFIYQPRWRGF